MTTSAGPYSPALRAGPWLVCSGQLGATAGPDGPTLVGDGIEEQGGQAMRNVADLLAAHGLDWSHVVKMSVFVTDIADYAAFNAVYIDALGAYRPARTLVAVAGLPLGARVEVEAWAYAEPTS